MLGVEARSGLPVGIGFLIEPIEGPVDRGGSLGFVSSESVEDSRELTEGWGLGV